MADDERASSLDQLMLALEKLEGRLVASDESKSRSDERLLRLAEEIGELRTMVLERERTFGGMQAEFERIRDIFETTDPMSVTRELEKKERDIMMNTVSVEKISTITENTNKEVRSLRDILDKLKGFENLVEISNEVQKKIMRVEDTKRYVDRLAAKTERIFGDMSRSMLELEGQKSTIENVDELSKEIIRSVDEIQLKLNNFVDEKKLDQMRGIIKEEDIGELRKSLEKSLEEAKVPPEVESRLGDIEQSVKGFETETMALKRKLTKVPIDEFGAKMGEIDNEVRNVRREIAHMRHKTEKHSIEELQNEKKHMVEVLELLDIQYDRRLITKESYEEAVYGNVKRLTEINAEIDDQLLTRRLIERVKEQSKSLNSLSERYENFLNIDDLMKFKEDIVDQDITRVRSELESQINSTIIPPDVRENIKSEIANEILGAVHAEMGDVVPRLEQDVKEHETAISEVHKLMEQFASRSELVQMRESIGKDELNGIRITIDNINDRIGVVGAIEDRMLEHETAVQKLVELSDEFIASKDLEEFRQDIVKTEFVELKSHTDELISAVMSRVSDHEFTVNQLVEMYESFMDDIHSDMVNLRGVNTNLDEKIAARSNELTNRLNEQNLRTEQLAQDYKVLSESGRDVEDVRAEIERRIDVLSEDLGPKVAGQRIAIKRLSDQYDNITGNTVVGIQKRMEDLSTDLKNIEKYLLSAQPDKVKELAESLNYKLLEVESNQSQLTESYRQHKDVVERYRSTSEKLQELLQEPIDELRADMNELSISMEEELKSISVDLSKMSSSFEEGLGSATIGMEAKVSAQEERMGKLADQYDKLSGEGIERLRATLEERMDQIASELLPQVKRQRQAVQRLTDVAGSQEDTIRDMKRDLEPRIEGQRVAIRRLTDLYDSLSGEEFESLRNSLESRIARISSEVEPQIKTTKQNLQKLTDLYYQLLEEREMMKSDLDAKLYENKITVEESVKALSSIDSAMIDKISKMERILEKIDESGEISITTPEKFKKEAVDKVITPRRRREKYDLIIKKDELGGPSDESRLDKLSERSLDRKGDDYIAQLKSERDEVVKYLDALNDQYRSGLLSRETYDAERRGTLLKIADIDVKLREVHGAESVTPPK